MTATATDTRPTRSSGRSADALPDPTHDGHSAGRGRGGHGPMTVDPRDRARLAEAPVPMSRVLALFSPHRARIAVVVVIIVVTSVIGLAQPFLVREVVDVALPQ